MAAWQYFSGMNADDRQLSASARAGKCQAEENVDSRRARQTPTGGVPDVFRFAHCGWICFAQESPRWPIPELPSGAYDFVQGVCANR